MRTPLARGTANWRNAAVIALVVILGALLLARVHYRLALVVGDSMRPGFHTGDLLLIDLWAYRRADPERGDIVLAEYHRDTLVKRVVGLPGEEVALRQGHLLINGAPVPERHAIQPGALDVSPGKLFAGRFALLGDNRALGLSQPVHAVVRKSEIMGKVVGCWHR